MLVQVGVEFPNWANLCVMYTILPSTLSYILFLTLSLTWYRNGALISISQNIVSQYSELIHSWRSILNNVLSMIGRSLYEIASVVVKDPIFYHGRSWGRRGRLREKKAHVGLLPLGMYIHVYCFNLTIQMIMITSGVTEEFNSSTAPGTDHKKRKRA